MFASLPRDLIQFIVEDYVINPSKQYIVGTVGVLSALDVAFCSRTSRAQMLEVIGLIRISDTWGSLSLLPLHSEAFFEWLASRGVKIRKLLVDPCGPLGLPRQPVCCVTDMIFNMANYDKEIDMEHLLPFVQCFPALTQVRMWYTICDEQFKATIPALEQLKGLTYLDLERCTYLTPEAVSCAACSLGGRLQSLKCATLDDSAIEQIAQWCHNIKQFCCFDAVLTSTNAVDRLCEVNSQLTHFKLQGSLRYITAEMLAHIARSCPLLQELDVNDDDFNELPARFVLPVVLTLCPLLRSVRLGNVSLSLEANARNQRIWELTSAGIISESFLGMLHKIPISISSFLAYEDSSRADEVAAGRAVCCLAERFGPTLIKFKWRIEYRPSLTNEVLYLLKCCPNLEYIALAQSDEYMRQSLPLIAVYCPKLTTIRLNGCGWGGSDLTDENMLVFCESFGESNVVTKLSISNMHLLTDETLTAIANAFHHLDFLKLASPQISADHMVNLIITGQLRARRLKKLHPDCARSVVGQLRRAGFVVHKEDRDVTHVVSSPLPTVGFRSSDVRN